MPTITTTVRAAETVPRNNKFSTVIRAILTGACFYLYIGIGTASADTAIQEAMLTAIADLPAAAYHDAAHAIDTRFVESFYAGRGYQPAWLDQGRLADLPKLRTVARSHGLSGDAGLIPDVTRQLERAQSSVGFQAWARLDVLATLAISGLICDLRFGHVDPTMQAVANADHAAQCDLDLVTQATLANSLTEYLDSLAPQTPLYQQLKLGLATHRRAAPVFPHLRLPPGRPLQIGMDDSRVPALRARLGIGPATTDPQKSRLYDDVLATAVRSFQKQHRLEADGVLGNQTIEALNITAQGRIDQIRVNMEWQRWALSDRQSNYLLVNVAHYIAYLVNDGQMVWSGRIQVGRSDRKTPSFKTAITSIVVNPSWTVPPTIFRKDILPKVRLDPGYLAENGLRVIDLHGRTISNQSIDWQQVTARNFGYRLRRKPGPGNALGRIKLQMPNRHLIFIHDTPAKANFDRDTRMFSSGCIRLEHPDELAERLLMTQTSASASRLMNALASRKTSRIPLTQSLPVIVTYNTIDLNESGELIFGPDVYGQDSAIVAALDKPGNRPRPPQRQASAQALTIKL